MPKAFSVDLRERIVHAYDEGYPVEDIVLQYSVSRSWLYSLLKQRRETGSIAPKHYQPGRKTKLTPYEKEVRHVVAEQPDATLDEFCEKLSKHILVSRSTVCRYLHHLKITRKKRLSVLPNVIETMSSNSVRNGRSSKKRSTLTNSFSSTKLGQKRT